MKHTDEGLLQAYIDGEVTDEAKASIVAHLDTCAECDRELEELRGAAASFRSAMSLMGSSADTAAARERVLRAHKAVIPIESRRPFQSVARGSLARAAGLVLLVATGAAAMIPGSPLRRWLGTGIDRISSAISPRPAAVPVVPAPAPAVVRRAMVPGPEMSIAPVNGRVRVAVFATAGSGQLSVRLVDGDRTSVQADSSAHAVAFRSAAGRIEILNLGTSDAVIELPRSLRGATIEVNGTTFFVKDGDSTRVTGPVVRRTDSEVVFQTGS
jgi:hypothetical protein